MRRQTILAVFVILGTAVSLAVAQNQMNGDENQHANTQRDMKAECQAMMAMHKQMMTDMAASNSELDRLVDQMQSATSERAKLDATAAVVAKLVEQREAMQTRMDRAHMAAMGHIMHHMQANGANMADCPMMREMSASATTSGQAPPR